MMGNSGTSRFRTGSAVPRCALALLIGLFGQQRLVLAQCQYRLDELPQISCGPFGGPGTPVAINIHGHVLYGGFCSSDLARLWTGPGEPVITISPPPGYAGFKPHDLNDLGEVVGEAIRVPGGLSEACLWRDGQAILLGIPPGGNYSKALGINNKSEVCGYWGNNGTGVPALRAFLWRDGVITDLDLPMGPNSTAEDINNESQIAGWMGQTPSINAHGYRWTNGVVDDLGVVPGGFSAEPKAISNNGTVAGWGRVADGQNKFGHNEGAVWRGNTPVHIPPHRLATETYVWDANDFAAVGYFDLPTSAGLGDPAYIFQDGKVRLLMDLADEPVEEISRTKGINDRGQIVSTVVFPGNAVRTCRLTPIGSTLGDVTSNCVVNVDDLLAVIAAWKETDSVADVDDNGLVDVQDLLLVVFDWDFL